MKRGYSAEQVRRAELPGLERGEPLTARAAAGLAAAVADLLPSPAARVLILAGSGNNGADAMYAGATLAEAGAGVVIVQVGDRLHEEALAAAVRAGARRERESTVSQVVELTRASAVLVDGILGTGTGASPALRGFARQLVAGILPLLAEPVHPIVVAVDIPSGIDPTTGAVPDARMLRADVTVTFGGYKSGLLQGAGMAMAGRVRLVDIGLEPELAAMEPVVVVP